MSECVCVCMHVCVCVCVYAFVCICACKRGHSDTNAKLVAVGVKILSSGGRGYGCDGLVCALVLPVRVLVWVPQKCLPSVRLANVLCARPTPHTQHHVWVFHELRRGGGLLASMVMEQGLTR